jgi:hypothetical protein
MEKSQAPIEARVGASMEGEVEAPFTGNGGKIMGP